MKNSTLYQLLDKNDRRAFSDYCDQNGEIKSAYQGRAQRSTQYKVDNMIAQVDEDERGITYIGLVQI